MMTPEEKEFYIDRNKKYMKRYAPDIESLSGLFIVFELYKLPNDWQIRELKELRRGNYKRATPEEISKRQKKIK